MRFGPRQWLKRLPALLTVPRPEPARRAERILTLQRHIILPVRLVAVAAAYHQLYEKPWVGDISTTYAVLFETFLKVFSFYAFFTLAMTVVFYVVRHFPPYLVQWAVFVMGLADGIFLAGLTMLTGGFDSVLYWVYPAVIVLNAISIQLATPQIVLNLLLSIFFLLAGVVQNRVPIEMNVRNLLHRRSVPKLTPATLTNFPAIVAWLKKTPEPLANPLWEHLSEATRTNLSTFVATGEHETEAKTALVADLNRFLYPLRVSPTQSAGPELPDVVVGLYILKIAVLVLLSFCCFGVQTLAARQQQSEEEQQEFSARTSQLHAAGRLAAEFAHQIKNPLTIINNVTFSLQKAFRPSKPEVSRQIEIIQEEVAKADRIITQIMGYAQLSEGRIEKLDVVQELDRVIDEVFPPAIPTDIKLHRDYAREFPPLLMQRRHFVESVANLLHNAREAVNTHGEVWISARCLGDYSIEVVVRDNGSGISPDKLESIFEAYYTTKTRGTGLGLAVVKHNVELYGGTVRVESGLGKGAEFVLLFPAKTLLKLGK
jgi:signal transduction histidine kinase